ncbi:uncharacterized protein V1518DRAFT_429675 [Limtongia smithiae]|uniref:uncharacterized protein n=1 Tax=Limtongia smithiae TaxID=1125753 RepID=UPI0034CF6BE9
MQHTNANDLLSLEQAPDKIVNIYGTSDNANNTRTNAHYARACTVCLAPLLYIRRIFSLACVTIFRRIKRAELQLNMERVARHVHHAAVDYTSDVCVVDSGQSIHGATPQNIRHPGHVVPDIAASNVIISQSANSFTNTTDSTHTVLNSGHYSTRLIAVPLTRIRLLSKHSLLLAPTRANNVKRTYVSAAAQTHDDKNDELPVVKNLEALAGTQISTTESARSVPAVDVHHMICCVELFEIEAAILRNINTPVLLPDITSQHFECGLAAFTQISESVFGPDLPFNDVWTAKAPTDSADIAADQNNHHKSEISVEGEAMLANALLALDIVSEYIDNQDNSEDSTDTDTKRTDKNDTITVSGDIDASMNVSDNDKFDISVLKITTTDSSSSFVADKVNIGENTIDTNIAVAIPYIDLLTANVTTIKTVAEFPEPVVSASDAALEKYIVITADEVPCTPIESYLLKVSATKSAESCSTIQTESDSDIDELDGSLSFAKLLQQTWISNADDEEWQMGFAIDDKKHIRYLTNVHVHEVEPEISKDQDEPAYRPVIVSSPTPEQFTSQLQTDTATISCTLLMNDYTRAEIMSEEYFRAHGHYVPEIVQMEYMPDKSCTQQGWIECTFGPWPPHGYFEDEINFVLRMMPPRLNFIVCADLSNSCLFSSTHAITDGGYTDVARSAANIAAGMTGCQTCFFMREYVCSVYERYRGLLNNEKWRMLNKVAKNTSRAFRYEYSGHVARLMAHSFAPQV